MSPWVLLSVFSVSLKSSRNSPHKLLDHDDSPVGWLAPHPSSDEQSIWTTSIAPFFASNVENPSSWSSNFGEFIPPISSDIGVGSISKIPMLSRVASLSMFVVDHPWLIHWPPGFLSLKSILTMCRSNIFTPSWSLFYFWYLHVCWLNPTDLPTHTDDCVAYHKISQAFLSMVSGFIILITLQFHVCWSNH